MKFTALTTLFFCSFSGTSHAVITAEYLPGINGNPGFIQGGDNVGETIPSFGWNDLQLGQSFRAGVSGNLNTIGVWTQQNTVSLTTRDFVLSLYTDNGSGLPDSLLTSVVTSHTIVPNFGLITVDFSGASSVSITAGESYVITMSAQGAGSDNQFDYRWQYGFGDGSIANPGYADGGRSRSINGGSTWSSQGSASNDAVFSVDVTSIPEASSIAMISLAALSSLCRRRRKVGNHSII